MTRQHVQPHPCQATHSGRGGVRSGSLACSPEPPCPFRASVPNEVVNRWL